MRRRRARAMLNPHGHCGPALRNARRPAHDTGWCVAVRDESAAAAARSMDRQAVGAGWRLSAGTRARAAAWRHLAHRQPRRPSCRCRRNGLTARARIQGRVGHGPAGARVSDRVGRSSVAVWSALDRRRRTSLVRRCAARACQHDCRSRRAPWRRGANAGRCSSQCADGGSTPHAARRIHCRTCCTLVQVGRCRGMGAGAHRGDSRLRVRPEPRARDRLESRASASSLRESGGARAKTCAQLARFHATLLALEHHTDDSLAAAAQRLGYFDQAHLAREFRAIAGTTITEYRRGRQFGADYGFARESQSHSSKS